MQRHIVGAADVGKGPSVLSEEHTMVVSFHDFENLPCVNGEETTSPIISCHGHSWSICVYPGGDYATVCSNFVSISLYLQDDPMSEVLAKYSLRVGSKTFIKNRVLFNRKVKVGIFEVSAP
jgi:hypothetical protein